MSDEAKVYDKTGREIVRGDVVKVFHFVGARRKRHYMYKQAMGPRLLTKSGKTLFNFAHLNLSGETYHEWAEGQVLPHYEIVQSIDARFDQRPRLKTPAKVSP